MSETGPIKLITQSESWSREVAADVVDALKDALTRAEAGEFTGISIIATTKDDNTWFRISNREHRGLMIAAASRLVYRLHQLDDQD